MEGLLILIGLGIPFMLIFTFVMTLANSSKLKDANKKIDQLSTELNKLKEQTKPSEHPQEEKETKPSPVKEEVSKPFKYAPKPVPMAEQKQPVIIKTKKPVHPVKESPKPAPVKAEAPVAQKPKNDPFEFIKNYLTQGNPIVKVAIILLFFASAFLMQYAHSRNLIPLWAKYAFVSTLGLSLTVIGWRLRKKRQNYALLLQGGGLGILYITLFSAFRLHHLLNGTATFTLLTILACLSVSSAIIQNSRVLAGFGVGGAFLAPILSSTGGGSHIHLFSFYMIINASIFLISLKKDWRELNLIGFSFSLIIAFLWASRNIWFDYTLSLEIFLYLFFLLYFAIPIIQSYKKQFNKLSLNLFYTLPVIITLIQTQILKGYENGLAWHLLTFTAIYATSSALVSHIFVKEQLRNIAIVCAYLAIPAFFSLSPSLSLLALASAASLTSKELCSRLVERTCAIISLIVSFFMYINLMATNRFYEPILNKGFISAIILSSAFFIAAISLRKNLKGKGYHALAQCFAVFSIPIFYTSILIQTDHMRDDFYKALLLFGGSSIFTIIWMLSSAHFKLPKLKYQLHIHTVFSLFTVIAFSITQSHIFDELWFFAYLPALGLSLYFLLQKGEKNNLEKTSFIILISSLIIPFSSSLHAFFQELMPSQKNFLEISGISVSLIFASAIIFFSPKLLKEYRKSLLISFEVLLSFFLTVTLTLKPAMRVDGFFAPIFNSYDLYQLFALALLIKMISFKSDKKLWITLYSFTGFFLANIICARALYHYGVIPRFNLKAIIDSSTAQVSYAILWSITGLILMIISKAKASATLWKFAAATFALTVIKLFLIDLSGTNTVARILSFLAVGLIMLVIGYFFPCPPSKEKE